LEPNQRNGGDHPLAVSQVIPAGAYRGRKVQFSGYLRSEGGAVAVLAMLNVIGYQAANLVMVPQAGGGSDWVQITQTYDVPDDPNVKLVLACMVNGHSGAAWFDDVSVVPQGATGAAERPSISAPAVSASPAVLQAAVEVDAANVIRQIPRTLFGTNIEWRWNASALWQEDARQPYPEIVRLTRDLGVSLIRYPGGVYSDFYHWRNGIGPYEKRPEVLHEPGKNDRSRPNFGTDEALNFAQQTNARLLITVNAGTGSPQEAGEWVRYVNGQNERVQYWEVGNELYINSDSPTSKPITVNPATYAARFEEFARAMRAADPRIKLLAIGGENRDRYAVVGYPDWDRTVLERCGDQMDFIAVHNGYAPALIQDNYDVRTVYRAMLAAPVLIARNLKTIAEQIDQYARARASQIGIAVTEWGPLFQFDYGGRYVDHPKTLGSALFAASALKAFIESPKTEIANFWMLNDFSVLGWISSRNGKFPPSPDWAPTARYYALQLYTRHFGDRLVASKVSGPTYDSEAVGLIDAVQNVPYLDVVSSLSPDGRSLYIMAINKHFDSAIDASLSVRGFQPASLATAWTLTGIGIDANTGTTVIQVPGLHWGRQAEDPQNPRFYKGSPGEVTLSSSNVSGIGPQFTYRFPAHSVTSLMLTGATDRETKAAKSKV
jgi:alpha-N-arabinofuranosidase